MYDLKGKVAIVTGAGRERGIGRGIAVRLAHEGADVVVADILRSFEEFPDYGLGDREGLEETARQVREAGVRALAVPVDVTDSATVDAMVSQALEAFGHIDILVNNAGGAPGPGPVILMEEAAWNKTLAINATGTFLCSRAVARHMIERGGGGKIINVSSIAAKAGGLFLSAYAAAKAAIIALTRAMALEVAQNNIQVNAVCPGEVDTELQRWGWRVTSFVLNMPYDEVIAEAVKRIPLGRLEVPEDVANLVAFLASSQSDYMTGQAINISGGMVTH
jgi:NAD(P)-dependent dehydrogenase (short-subunit alcohol dehydrogenase family)